MDIVNLTSQNKEQDDAQTRKIFFNHSLEEQQVEDGVFI